MSKIIRLILWIPILLSAAACAPLIGILGYSGQAIQAAAQMDQVKLMADGVSYVSTGKTVSDHVISAATGSDCKVTNILSKAPVCIAANSETSSAPATN